MLQQLKNDEKIIEIVSQYTKVDQNQVKEKFEEFITQSPTDLDTEDTIILSVYVNKKSPVRYEIELKESELKFIMNTTEKQTEIQIIDGVTTLLTLINKKINEKEYDTTIKINTIEIKINTILKDNQTDINYEIIESVSQAKIHGSIKSTEEIVNETEEHKGNIQFVISIDVNGLSNILLLEMDSNYTTNTNVNIEEENITNTIQIEELIEEKINEIVNKLLENEAIKNFIGTINGILYSM